MEIIKVVKPSSFFTIEPLTILDKNGNYFYVHPNKEGALIFNLPIGIFFTNNKVYQRDFKAYENSKFDIVQSLEGYKLTIGENPHKCTINLRTKTILMSPMIFNLKYEPAIRFVLGHEGAHTIHGGNILKNDGSLVYNAEAACDNCSKNYMLANGYNPTQIEISTKITLRDFQRRQCIDNSLTKHNFKK